VIPGCPKGMATDPDFHIKPRRATLNHAPRVYPVHRLRRQRAGATGCRTEERAFGPSSIPAASIACRGSVPGCDVPASRGAWFVPKSMRLQPERSCSSVRRLDAVHRTDRAVSVTPGDGVGGTFRVWRRRNYLSALGRSATAPDLADLTATRRFRPSVPRQSNRWIRPKADPRPQLCGCRMLPQSDRCPAERGRLGGLEGHSFQRHEIAATAIKPHPDRVLC